MAFMMPRCSLVSQVRMYDDGQIMFMIHDSIDEGSKFRYMRI